MLRKLIPRQTIISNHHHRRPVAVKKRDFFAESFKYPTSLLFFRRALNRKLVGSSSLAGCMHSVAREHRIELVQRKI